MVSQYDLPKKSRRGDDPRGKEGKIREAAAKYGIDPEIALKVAKSEGLRDFLGDGGKSGGAFQLYTGGGLGNKFKKETGLDPLDPKNEDATIDFAMKEAKQSGWKPWYGAAKVGVGQWDGISGGGAGTKTDAASGYGGIGSDAAASERASRIQGTDTSTETPEVAQNTPQGPAGATPPLSFIDKLKQNTGGAGDALGSSVTNLGMAATGAGKGLYPTTATQPAQVPVITTPQPQVMPTVNPQVAADQRQQLAAAMQRLNSGRLY